MIGISYPTLFYFLQDFKYLSDRTLHSQLNPTYNQNTCRDSDLSRLENFNPILIGQTTVPSPREFDYNP